MNITLYLMIGVLIISWILFAIGTIISYKDLSRPKRILWSILRSTCLVGVMLILFIMTCALLYILDLTGANVLIAIYVIVILAVIYLIKLWKK